MQDNSKRVKELLAMAGKVKVHEDVDKLSTPSAVISGADKKQYIDPSA